MKENKTMHTEKEIEKDRPTSVTVYLVFLVLGIIGGIWGIFSFSKGALMVLGAVLSGELLLGYMAIWAVIGVIQLFGIMKRKSWVVDLTIAVLVVQIFSSLGQLMYLDQSLQLAYASIGTLTAAQQAQAMQTGKPITMVSIAIGVAICAFFIFKFHNYREYFNK